MERDAAPRVLPYGDRALLVEVADLAAVAAVRAALEGAPLPGQRDLVPAARTVLVVLDRAPTDLDVGDAAPAVADGAGRTAARPPRVELPVVFDGADLADVAELTGRTVAELVGRPDRASSSPSPSAGSRPGSAT